MQDAFELLSWLNAGTENSHDNPSITNKGIVLFLDIDGTLVDFHSNPEQVRLADSVRRILERLAQSSAVDIVFVTGRSIASADQVTGMYNLAVAGSHGAEIRLKGVYQRPSVFSSQQHVQIKAVLDTLIARFPELFYEDKCVGFALHYNKNSALRDVCYCAMKEQQKLLGKGYRLLSGRNVVEIQSCDYDKGTAIEYFMRQPMFHEKVPWFIGDDTTDENGFIVVNRLDGISIKVRHQPLRIETSVGTVVSTENTESAANYFLTGVGDVQKWLGLASHL